MLYRVAEVIGERDFPEHPYTLGSRKTTKRLHLEFGESKQWYMMSSISNQPFDEFELRSWHQARASPSVPAPTQPSPRPPYTLLHAHECRLPCGPTYGA